MAGTPVGATNEAYSLMESGDSSEPEEGCHGKCETILYFSDNKRRIDYVLAYLDDFANNAKHKSYFDAYMKSLENLGLQTEMGCSAKKEKNDYGSIEETAEEKEKSAVRYILVHAPIDVLYNSAEDLKMKMPTKLNDISIEEWFEKNAIWKCFDKINCFRIRQPQTREATNYFVRTFDKDRLCEFVNSNDTDNFFSPAERGRLVYYIMQRAPFGGRDTDIGIETLEHKGVFLDAFPLHDGPALKHSSDTPVNERQRLQKDWASPRCLFKYQPIDAIREYFGEKIALYFAWLGYYTSFLVPAAIIGILCFIYGIFTALSDPSVTESCTDLRGPNGTHLFYMCPLCDKACSYFLLSTNCMYSKASHIFDNGMTLFFSVFMSIWATVFLEFWKRKDVSLAYEWHSMGFKEVEEQVRPEYNAYNQQLKLNPVTQKMENYMPKRQRYRRMSGTVGVVAFFILLVLVAVVGVAIFRAAISVALLTSGNKDIQTRTKMIVSAMAGCLNLVAINILKFFYNRIAVLLTDYENPRTRTDYEDSFTIKMFLFQFFNTYTSIIYVAFLKTDAITGSPGQYKRLGKGRFRMDGCSSQGCFLELTIQLIIIMVGQQFISNIVETLLPTTLKWWRKRKEKKRMLAQGVEKAAQPQWVDDYEGEMQTKFSLFWEYLEIVVQYGFVTMFVAAFPLAPFFALFNNICEIRVDAYNYVANFRRPVAERAEDIGAWYSILATLTNVSILVNAFVIAFTSDFVPTMVYSYRVSPDGSMKGYLDWSLSSFNVADFKNESRPLNPTQGGIPVQSQCRYAGFHDSAFPYARNMTYWVVLSCRLAFVLSFVLFVLAVSKAIKVIIPDMPESLKLKIKRERFLAAQADHDHKVKQGKRKKVE